MLISVTEIAGTRVDVPNRGKLLCYASLLGASQQDREVLIGVDRQIGGSGVDVRFLGLANHWVLCGLGLLTFRIQSGSMDVALSSGDFSGVRTLDIRNVFSLVHEKSYAWGRLTEEDKQWLRSQCM